MLVGGARLLGEVRNHHDGRLVAAGDERALPLDTRVVESAARRLRHRERDARGVGYKPVAERRFGRTRRSRGGADRSVLRRLDRADHGARRPVGRAAKTAKVRRPP